LPVVVGHIEATRAVVQDSEIAAHLESGGRVEIDWRQGHASGRAEIRRPEPAGLAPEHADARPGRQHGTVPTRLRAGGDAGRPENAARPPGDSEGGGPRVPETDDGLVADERQTGRGDFVDGESTGGRGDDGVRHDAIGRDDGVQDIAQHAVHPAQVQVSAGVDTGCEALAPGLTGQARPHQRL
jgi:hypothetical protein